MQRTVLLLGAVCVLPLSAAPRSKKAEKPDQAVKRVAKAFGKLKSYEAQASITGGIARGGDHRVSSPSVDKTYTLLARGKVMRLEGPLVGFRLRGAVDGATQDGQHWKKLLTPPAGRAMTRLCDPPEALLAEVMRLKKRARYVDLPEDTGPGEILASVTEDEEEAGTRTGSRNGTSSSKAQGEAEPGPQPRHIVIEATGKIAVRHFERVLSSGCLLSGG